MITNEQVDLLLQQYYDRGILKKEIRSYEVSLWTLQDDFITVLKWSDVEQKGRIESPKMTLNIDGTQKLSFTIPMFYTVDGRLIDNPNWYTVKNGNLIMGLRKLKVIFNKGTELEQIFDFMITDVKEVHENDILKSEISAEGLAFQELGKIGYKISLSQDNFELVYKDWQVTHEGDEPIQSLDYWCQEAGLVKYDPAHVNPKIWYYDVRMSWKSFDSEGVTKVSDKIYEVPYTSAWDANLNPLAVESSREKARPIEVEKSNLYNITQTIAETFEVFCCYEYLYDENYHIIGRIVVFYNSFMQEDKIFSITYPYSLNKIERSIESNDITTKLFVLDVDNENTLSGYNSIMNALANASREDYILNFDYLHENNAITQEQYDAILPYERSMRAYNDILIDLQSKLATYQTKLPELEAKYTIAKNSVELDQEQILQNSALRNALTNDGYITLTAANADTLLIITRDNGTKYLSLNNTNKGIKDDSVKIYRTITYSGGTPSLTNQVTSFELVHDDQNNLKEINLLNISQLSDSTKLYLTYSYDPKLYYDNIVKTWEVKQAQDIQDRDAYEEELGQKDANDRGISGLYKAIDDLIDDIDEQIAAKNAAIKKFERLMGPALREGYWQPEDYKDYGERHNYSSTVTSNDITVDVGDNAIIAWDDIVFDGEDVLYYKVGVNQDIYYYPCIDLNAVFSNSIPTDLEDYSLVWKATNITGYEYDWNSIKDLQVFAVGSQALIKFIKYSNTVKPVLMIVGAKNLSDDQITRMISTGRLEKYSTSVNTGSVTVSHNSVTTIGNNWITVATNTTITTTPIIYPRIKFSSLVVKTDTTNLVIRYNGQLLNQYKDYYINVRNTERNSNYYLEYYVTIKPEVLVKCSLNQQVDVNYVLSNANTSIYLDAKKVSKENAFPKVSYNVNISLLSTDLINILYSLLARVVMINDTDLKLEDVFGYISQVDLDLDNCANDTIEIKNYKTKFEDLFSTIVAQTEAMKQSEANFSAAMSGDMPLSSEATEETLSSNINILNAYFDSYFDSSEVVRDKLESLFTEAGEILSNSNKSLSQLQALSLENASILSNFTDKVNSELTPKIYTGAKPTLYKPGDIWIDNEGNHYVATAYSSEGGNAGTSGFVRTYDGTLASITGAALDVNADDGEISIKAQNNVNISSADVNIVGNKSVNIGGTTINIAAESTSGTVGTVGGVNIVATHYNTSNIANAQVAKVLIHPTEITMAGAKINMYAGTTSGSVSAISIDGTVNTQNPTPGIWIGSSKSVELYSGIGTSTGSSVSIKPDHIIMGTVSDSSSAVFDLRSSYIVMAVGTTSSDFSSSNVTINASSSITGMKLTQGSFGIAAGSGSTRSVILANSDGITVGTGATPLTSGSYVSISGSGISLGSLGDLYINTNNFKLQTNAGATSGTLGTTVFAIGTNLSGISNSTNPNALNSSSTVNFLVNGNGAFIKGYIYADGGSFTGSVNASSFIATCTNGKFKAIGANLGLYDNNDNGLLIINNSGSIEAMTDLTISSSKTLTLAGASLSFTAVSGNVTGTLNIDSANFKVNSSPSNGENYFYTGDSGNNPNSYVRYVKDTTNGDHLEVKGAITATTFRLSGNNYDGIKSSDIDDFTTAVQSIAGSGGWSINGLSNGTREISATNSTTISTVELTSTYGLVLGANYGVFIPKTSTSKLDDTYVSITQDHINFDYSSSNYIHMDNNGIEVSGNRISINGKEVWARDDIIVMNPNATGDDSWRSTVSGIETHQNGATHDWVLIRPYYDGRAEGEAESSIINVSVHNDYGAAEVISNPKGITLGDNATYYKYIIKGKIRANPSINLVNLYYRLGYSDTNGIQYPVTVSAATAATTLDSTTFDYIAYNSSNQPVIVNTNYTSFETKTKQLANANIFKDGRTPYIQFYNQTSSDFTITELTIECICDITTSRVPCTVYYYPYITS